MASHVRAHCSCQTWSRQSLTTAGAGGQGSIFSDAFDLLINTMNQSFPYFDETARRAATSQRIVYLFLKAYDTDPARSFIAGRGTMRYGMPWRPGFQSGLACSILNSRRTERPTGFERAGLWQSGEMGRTLAILGTTLIKFFRGFLTTSCPLQDADNATLLRLYSLGLAHVENLS